MHYYKGVKNMKEISKEVKTYWLWKFGMDKVYPDEMLAHFRNYYGFKGTFEELIEILQK